jgi:hypothetical protein
MALELARPGTLALAVDGFDQQSKRYLDAAVEDGMKGGAIFESRPRPANLPAALQTTIESARTALRLQTNDQMRAHHLIPANVWATVLDIATLASQAGWQPDSDKNLIALPADQATQAKLVAEEGLVLPIHNSSHPIYDRMARGAILVARAEYGKETPTPAQARAIFEEAAMIMRKAITDGAWMPKLR